MEPHTDIDQFFRFEEGEGVVMIDATKYIVNDGSERDDMIIAKIRPIRAPFDIPPSGKPHKIVRFNGYKNGGQMYPRLAKYGIFVLL
jgi:hypothetical protein